MNRYDLIKKFNQGDGKKELEKIVLTFNEKFQLNKHNNQFNHINISNLTADITGESLDISSRDDLQVPIFSFYCSQFSFENGKIKPNYKKGTIFLKHIHYGWVADTIFGDYIFEDEKGQIHEIDFKYDFEELKFKLTDEVYIYNGKIKNLISTRHKEIDCQPEEVYMLINKIYRLGLKHLNKDASELAINDEDREFYHEQEEKDKNTLMKNNPPTKVDNSKENVNILHTPLTDADVKKIEAYESMKKAGINLSEEQIKELQELYLKLDKKQKLEEYRAKAPTLNQHRQEEFTKRKEKNASLNEKWMESYKTTTDKRNKMKEELKKMSEQIQALSQLKSISPDILTEEQENLLNNNETFVKYSEIESKHLMDDGMAPEIREMLAEYYQEQEKNGKRK